MSTYTTHRIIQGQIGASVASAVPEHPYMSQYFNRTPQIQQESIRTDERPSSDDTLDAQLLREDHGRFLPDEQRRRVRVRTDVGWPDGQVRNFESLDSIHTKAGIDDTASFARFHPASAELLQSNWRDEKSLAYYPNTCARIGSETKKQDEGGMGTHRVPACAH